MPLFGGIVPISSKTRPQDPGGGAAGIAAPGGGGGGVMDIEFEFTRVVRCGASVGSLTDFGGVVEEAKVGGTQCLGCPRVDQDLRLLAGVAKSASVTVKTVQTVMYRHVLGGR